MKYFRVASLSPPNNNYIMERRDDFMTIHHDEWFRISTALAIHAHRSVSLYTRTAPVTVDVPALQKAAGGHVPRSSPSTLPVAPERHHCPAGQGVHVSALPAAVALE